MDGWITYKIMKAQFLKISGHKNEKDFYKEFPTMEAFMAKHGPAAKKAQSGAQLDNNGNGVPDYLENMTPANYNQQFGTKGPTQYNPQGGAPSNNGSDTTNMLTSLGTSAAANSGSGQGFGGMMKGMFSGGDAGNGGFSNIGKSFGIGGGGGGASGAAGAAGKGGGMMKGLSGMMGGKGGGGGGASNAGAYVQAAINVGQGVAELKKEKQIKRKARADRDVVKVVRNAFDSVDVNKRQDYMDNAKRTRDALVPTVDTSDLFPTYGTGSNPLQARSGGEITNTYAPKTLYNDLGYEPLEESAIYKPITDNEVVKHYRYGGTLFAQNGNTYGQMANTAATAATDIGQNNQMMALGNTYSQSTNISKTNNAGGKIGGGIGMAVGTYFGGPLGGMVGKWAGTMVGGALDSNYKKIKGFNYQKEQDVNYMKNTAALQNVRASNFGSYTKDGGVMYRTGGNLRQNNVGDIEALSGGHLEPISYNPYSDGNGTTSMIKGQTHEESNGRHSGVLLSYNKSNDGSSMEADVEAENNEPVTEIGNTAVIFGNMVINEKTVGNDPMFKNLHGKTFKKAMAGIAEQNQKLNKQQTKNTQALNSLDPKTPIDKLKLNSLAINAKAIDTKYAINDAMMKKAAAYQEEVNKEASRLGINSGDFSRGKLSNSELGIAKNGKTQRPKLEAVNQIESRSYDIKPYDLPKANIDFNDRYVDSSGRVISNDPEYDVTPYDKRLDTLQTIAGQVLPWFRDQPGENLQNDQISGELNALSDNDVDPVQARFYRPNLRSPYDVSYQDQLNENQADFNQMVNASSDNPEALAALAAQKYQANSRVLGEQFRQNQAAKEAVYSQNTGILNAALEKNLQIADQQYVRQAQAKSATKAVRQEALSSIASKVAQNRLENRTLQTYANMFPDYSYDNNYRIRKTGAPAQFNIDQGIYKPKDEVNQLPIYDADGVIIGYKPIEPEPTTKKDTEKGKYGALVKAFKNI